jgi:uncharacterized protein (TIGR03435 family)
MSLMTSAVKLAGFVGACFTPIVLSSGFSQQTFRFEVASIKPSKNRNFIGVDLGLGGRLMGNAPLNLLIANAYRVKQQQIVGGPAWINSDLYSIEAKGERSATRIEMLLAFQALLQDRFRLRIERETRTLGVYVLTVGKGGIKRRLLSGGGCPVAEANKPVGPPGPDQPPCGRVTMMFSPTRSRLEGRNISIADLVERLSNFVDRPLIDRTGYRGTLDLKLEFVPERAVFGLSDGALIPGETTPADQDGPASLSTAVQEQLGLRIEYAKVPVDVIAIKHVERPTAN